jgi:hypothetical protein
MWPVAPQYMVWIPYFCIIKDKVLSYHLVGRREEKTKKTIRIPRNCTGIWSGNHYTMIDETWGSHSDYYHVVDVLSFGAVCFCRSMPTFWRNMLSPSSGVEVTRQGGRGVFYRTWRAWAEGREPIIGREYGNWMQTNREPSGMLQRGGWVWSEKEEREREKVLFRAHRRASCSC